MHRAHVLRLVHHHVSEPRAAVGGDVGVAFQQLNRRDLEVELAAPQLAEGQFTVQAFLALEEDLALPRPDQVDGDVGLGRGGEVGERPEILAVREVGEGTLAAQGLAKFKLPERVEAMSAFPVTRVGKLDKMALRKAVEAKLEEERRGGG